MASPWSVDFDKLPSREQQVNYKYYKPLPRKKDSLKTKVFSLLRSSSPDVIKRSANSIGVVIGQLALFQTNLQPIGRVESFDVTRRVLLKVRRVGSVSVWDT
ncbi:hypothetical protein TNCV_1717971 [Trichonephila clavipes]|nr:hypothetical protein TNCV_1717971 [Trichonephila clavipes]